MREGSSALWRTNWQSSKMGPNSLQSLWKRQWGRSTRSEGRTKYARVFKMLWLGLDHVTLWKVEHIFGKKLEDDHVVLAERWGGLACADNVWHKWWPFLRPFLFDNLNKWRSERKDKQHSKLFIVNTLGRGRHWACLKGVSLSIQHRCEDRASTVHWIPREWLCLMIGWWWSQR